MQYVTLTPEFQTRLIAGERRQPRRRRADPDRRPGAQLRRQRLRQRRQRVRRRRPLLRLGGQRLRDRQAGPVHGPQRLDDLGPRLGDRPRARRSGPLIVITNGSVQAPEQLYWGQAATLAKHGYVVLTYDPQGQGRSDTFGEGVDRSTAFPRRRAGRSTTAPRTRSTSRSRPPSSPTTRGRAARPAPTTPRSRTGGSRRGCNAAYNPLADLVDPSRVGIAGHSLGAAAVSYVGQIDERVDAIAAWDNLSAPGERPRLAARLRLRLLAAPGRPADHQAGARDLQRLRDHADAEHLRPRPAEGKRRLSSPTRRPASTRWSSTSAAAPTRSRRSSPG